MKSGKNVYVKTLPSGTSHSFITCCSRAQLIRIQQNETKQKKSYPDSTLLHFFCFWCSERRVGFTFIFRPRLPFDSALLYCILVLFPTCQENKLPTAARFQLLRHRRTSFCCLPHLRSCASPGHRNSHE